MRFKLGLLLALFIGVMFPATTHARGHSYHSFSSHSYRSHSSRSHSFGDVSVHGYFRKNGTYVHAHHRSRPDGNFYNNWSTKGNINPYTGKEGTKVTPPPSEAP